MRYQIFRRKGDNQLYFHFKTNDGKVILTSQFYQAKTDCDNGIRSVIKNAPEDARYDRTKGADGKHIFTLKAGNGQEIGKSVGFDSEAEMEKAITLLKRMKFKTAAKKTEPPKDDAPKKTASSESSDFSSGVFNGFSYQSWQSEKNQEYYFNFKGSDGKVFLKSEGYTSKASCDNGIESVMKNAGDARRYERKVAKNGKHYFDLKAGNGQIIGTSAMFDSEDDMNKSISGLMGGSSSTAKSSNKVESESSKKSVAAGIANTGGSGDKKENDDKGKKDERTYLGNGKYPHNNITWETFQSGGNERFYFVFKTTEDKAILINGDVRGYETKAELDQGVKEVISFAPDSKNYLYKTSKNGKHYFYIKNSDDKNVARGSLFFDSEEDMQASIKMLLGAGGAAATTKTSSAGSGVDEYLPVGAYQTTPGFATFKHKNGEYYFSFNNEAGKVLLRSEGYSSEAARDNGVKSVTKNASLAERYTVDKDDEGHYFALKAGNHQEIARSGGYNDKAGCEADMAWLQGEKSSIGLGSKLVGGTLMSAWMISSGAKSDADAKAKADMEAKKKADADAKAKADMEAKKKADADAKAKADMEAKKKADADAKAKADMEAKKKADADAKAKADMEAKKKADADAKAKADMEAKKKADADAKAKADMEAKKKAEADTKTKATAAGIVAGAATVNMATSSKEESSDKKEIDDYMPCANYIGGKAGFVHFKIEKNNLSYFNYNDDKGKVLLVSQGYKSDAARDNGVESVQKNASLDERWSTFKEEDGKWYYALKAGNHQEIARSCPYDNEGDMKTAYAWLRSEHSTLGKGAQIAGGIMMSAFAFAAYSKNKASEAAAFKLQQDETIRIKAEKEAEATRIRIEAEAKKKAEADAKVRAEMEAKKKAEADAKAKADAEAKAKADAAAKVKAEAEAKKKEMTKEKYLPCNSYKTGNKGFVKFQDGISKEYFFSYNDEKGNVMLRSEGFKDEAAREKGITLVNNLMKDKNNLVKKSSDAGHYYSLMSGKNEVARSCMHKEAAGMTAAMAFLAAPLVAKKVLETKKVETKKVVNKEKEDDYLPCKAYIGHPIKDKQNKVAYFKKDGQFYFVMYNKDKTVKLRSEGFSSEKDRDAELAGVLKNHNNNSMYSEVKKGDYRIRILKDKTGREVGRSCAEKVKKVVPVAAAAVAVAAAAPIVKKEKKVEKIVKKKVVKETPIKKAAPVVATAADKSGCAWWYLLPFLLLIPLIWFGMKGCNTAPVVPAVVAPIEKVIEAAPPVKEVAPVAPKGCTANCTGSKNKIFNIPQGKSPKTLTRLGTNPEFGNSHALNPEQFFNKLKDRHSNNNTDKRFLDNLFTAMGYTGFGEVTAAAFSNARISSGTIGNIGASPQHRTVYARLNTSGKDLEAFRIKGKNGCDIHFMKTCGNHFFYCPN